MVEFLQKRLDFLPKSEYNDIRNIRAIPKNHTLAGTFCFLKEENVKMKDIKPIVAANLATLRKENGLTQAELAEKLNYSDKAVSRWEHGDTLPDINVLMQLCDFYGITLDALVNENTEFEKQKKSYKASIGYRIWLCVLSVAVVWLCATVVFVYSQIVNAARSDYWIVFVWAVPISCLVVLLMSKGMPNRNIISLICASVFSWSVLTCTYLHFISYNLWLIFVVGVPVEVVIVLWYKIKQFK